MYRRSVLSGTLCAFILAFTLTASAAGRGAPEAGTPAADGTLPGLTAIAGRGMMNSDAFQFLEELSDEIGGRLTGSPQGARAIQWGLSKMRAIGLENVHEENWRLFRGWTRVSADAELVSPIQRRLTVASLGWVGSTPPGGVEAEVIPVNLYQLDHELRQNTSQWAGKILLMITKGEPPKPEEHMKLFARFGTFLDAAYKAHAVAVVGGQGGRKAAGMNLTHTGILGFNTFYNIPVVSIVGEDQDQLGRFLNQGKAVRLRINVQNRVTEGPVDSANVVGDVRGTEHPEQIIVVGGHLDSWDLAEGSTDDGVGVATTLGAAEAIVASGFKPKRTIRFVLFTGEEQGLDGSFAYVKTHKPEMENHVAALILDNGQGPVVGLSLGGRNDLLEAVRKFTPAIKAFGEIKVDDNASFDTDVGPFILAGLPGINMDQDSPEYRFTHHSVVDTFDKVKPETLLQDTTVVALAAFWIADRPERLATPWPAEKTAHMLIEKKQDILLKAFGLWPFGNIEKEKE